MHPIDSRGDPSIPPPNYPADFFSLKLWAGGPPSCDLLVCSEIFSTEGAPPSAVFERWGSLTPEGIPTATRFWEVMAGGPPSSNLKLCAAIFSAEGAPPSAVFERWGSLTQLLSH